MLSATLFTTASMWYQPSCPSMHDYIDTGCRNDNMTFARKWMELETNEVSPVFLSYMEEDMEINEQLLGMEERKGKSGERRKKDDIGDRVTKIYAF